MVESNPNRPRVSDPESDVTVPLTSETDSSKPGDVHSSLGRSRWSRVRAVMLGGAGGAGVPPLKRQDSFLQRFSTRSSGGDTGHSSGDDDDKEREGIGICKSDCVLHPDNSFLFWWMWVVTVSGLHFGWTLVLRQAFPELQYHHDALWKFLDGACDAVYLLDVAIQARTGFLEQGVPIREGRRLAKRYITSLEFLLDAAALLPLGHVDKMPLLSFLRFLKARRIFRFYYIVESRTPYPDFWRLLNLVHVLLLAAHWVGCLRHMLLQAEGAEETTNKRRPYDGSAMARAYLGSMYWSTLTLTTIGDLTPPISDNDYLFTIVSYLLGVFIFATIVGQVGNVIANRNASRMEFERMLDGAKLYMRQHGVPKDMQRRVQRWYDYSWSRCNSYGASDVHSESLRVLPDKIKTELAIQVNLKTLKKVSIFKECRPEFLHDLVLRMRAHTFAPSDIVCRRGEVAREMYIIVDGVLQVINDQGHVLTHLKSGDFFGEIGILNLDGFNRRTADVVSLGYSELFGLSREDVLTALRDHPEAKDVLFRMGRKRLLEIRGIKKVQSQEQKALPKENIEHKTKGSSGKDSTNPVVKSTMRAKDNSVEGRRRSRKNIRLWRRFSGMVRRQNSDRQLESILLSVSDRGRRTKSSISNWSRSELFWESSDEGMIQGTSPLHEEVITPITTSPSISPMSSRYSMSPSTSEDEDTVAIEESPNDLDHIERYVSGIARDLVSIADSYLNETNGELILRIKKLEEESMQKDKILQELQLQLQVETESDNLNKKIYTSEKDLEAKEEEENASLKAVPEVRIEEDDLWLIEFPKNEDALKLRKRGQLRRHSSVEVEQRAPSLLATHRMSEDLHLRQRRLEPKPTILRRFSESQARPDKLRSTFASKVRKVLSKVKATRNEANNSQQSPAEQQLSAMGPGTLRRSNIAERPTKTRQLPTIIESSSADSLREYSIEQNEPPKED